MKKDNNFYKKTDEIIRQCESEIADLEKLIFDTEKEQIKEINLKNKKVITFKKV